MIDAKNAVLIVGVLAVVSLVGLYLPYQKFLRDTKNAPTNFATSTYETSRVTVVYTDKGFEPSSITVKLGTTVQWLNASNKLMWVASDPHPSHTNLPGFDERGVDSHSSEAIPMPSIVPTVFADGPSGQYLYTFLKAGSWGYHNHLVPADRGTIVVESL